MFDGVFRLLCTIESALLHLLNFRTQQLEIGTQQRK